MKFIMLKGGMKELILLPLVTPENALTVKTLSKHNKKNEVKKYSILDISK
jgi:hypothetical protein